MTTLTTTRTESHPAVSTTSWSLRDPAEIDEFFGGNHCYLPAVLDRYRLDAQLVSTPDLSVEWFQHHGDVIIEESTPGRQIFGFLPDLPGRLVMGGLDVSPYSIIAASPELHVARSTGPNDYAVISLPNHLVDTHGRAMRDLGASRRAYARLANLLSALKRLARAQDPCPAAMLAAVESVADGLYRVIDDAAPPERPLDSDLATEIVMQAVAAIREDQASSITELTRHVSASRSSLYRSFEAVMGLSPYAYMRERRLIRLRRRLLAVDDEPGVVTREAANLGAFHLGHLANSYHKMFGELPSDTAKRRLSGVSGDDPVHRLDEDRERARQPVVPPPDRPPARSS